MLVSSQCYSRSKTFLRDQRRLQTRRKIVRSYCEAILRAREKNTREPAEKERIKSGGRTGHEKERSSGAVLSRGVFVSARRLYLDMPWAGGTLRCIQLRLPKSAAKEGGDARGKGRPRPEQACTQDYSSGGAKREKHTMQRGVQSQENSTWSEAQRMPYMGQSVRPRERNEWVESTLVDGITKPRGERRKCERSNT